tara:strand:- start:288 stop:1340 length:1053 start_codon:yes stop_codon:yes gene_type:complete
MPKNSINFIQAINLALKDSMKKNKNIICYGLGTTDPKAIFGTTKNLESIFGQKRVFDTPTSENALTGIAIGASLGGVIPVVSHQRVDFFLLAMDQLVNSAAKWHYMFGSQISVPITIRLIVGRGWGQGPTHSQNLHSWFAHIPGLKVVAPTNPNDAYSLLRNSIEDPNPVIFLEHRWLHNSQAINFKKNTKVKIGKANKLKNGKDITIVSMSYLVPEALNVIKTISSLNIDVELIDIRTIKPLDITLISKSVRKTGRLLILDTGFEICSFASEILSKVILNDFKYLKTRPEILTMPDISEPTSYALTKNFYITEKDIIKKIFKILKINKTISTKKIKHHDVPGNWFKGPF